MTEGCESFVHGLPGRCGKAGTYTQVPDAKLGIACQAMLSLQVA